jgi:hypothetical protein
MAIKILIKGFEFILHFLILRELTPESYGKYSLVTFMLHFHRFIAFNCIRPAVLKRAETLESGISLKSSQNLVSSPDDLRNLHHVGLFDCCLDCVCFYLPFD